jgi:hypothetical protein
MPTKSIERRIRVQLPSVRGQTRGFFTAGSDGERRENREQSELLDVRFGGVPSATPATRSSSHRSRLPHPKRFLFLRKSLRFRFTINQPTVSIALPAICCPRPRFFLSPSSSSCSCAYVGFHFHSHSYRYINTRIGPSSSFETFQNPFASVSSFFRSIGLCICFLSFSLKPTRFIKQICFVSLYLFQHCVCFFFTPLSLSCVSRVLSYYSCSPISGPVVVYIPRFVLTFLQSSFFHPFFCTQNKLLGHKHQKKSSLL